MNRTSPRERIKQCWRWQSSKTLLIIASAITVVISVFEITLDPIAMLREIASNFITCLTITFITGTIIAAFGMPWKGRSLKRSLLLLILLAIGGMVGGLISWGVNELLFPYRITDPYFYLMVVALLAIIFGLAGLAYESVSVRLQETASKLAEKEVREQQLLRLKTQAELEAIRAKVNPHFLFNTLNSIASLIPEDPDKAEDTVQRLSNLFHYVLSASDSDVVPLEKELDFVGQYLQIEKVRLGERLDYTIEKGTSLDGTVIPSMLLQPIVENSVKYGIAPHKNGGRIEIRCHRQGDRCQITIADTGRGFDTASTVEGFGISGVRRRLELNYPGNYGFDITSGSGVTVQIEIPVTNDLQDNPRG
jgi:sensor histidine kinase YesM